MKRFSILALLALTLAPCFAQEADDILEKSNKAMGADAAKGITSYIVNGEMSMSNGMSGKMTIYFKEGNKLLVRQVIESMGVEMTMGCDGNDCYANDAMMGLRKLEGQDKDQLIQGNNFTSSLDYKANYPKREYKGEADVNGKAAHKVYLETEGGMKMTNYYDKESYMLVKNDVTMKSPMGEMTAESWVKDYKDIFKGFTIPSSMLAKTMGMEINMKFTEVEVNVDIPDSKFALPAGL